LSEAYPRLVLTHGGATQTLSPFSLASEGRNEAWLRDFLLSHPAALPSADIDPAFGDLVSVCSELRTAAGPLDALFVNRHGALVLVECKLFRNPQARREVIGQILDYAKELARWGYADLEAAVSQRLGRPGENVLFRIAAAQHPELDEAGFVDAVSQNLAQGRFLLLIAGDGIRRETEAIAEYVQDHAALRFTLGLVEMRGFVLPDGGLIVQPRLLVRTREVERVVFRMAGPIASVEQAESSTYDGPIAADDERSAASSRDRAFWLEFDRRLVLDDPSQPRLVKRGLGNARASLGHPDVWITAYRSRAAGEIGVFVRFRGVEGRRIWTALRDEAEAIGAELNERVPGTPIDWPDWDEAKGSTSVLASVAAIFAPEQACDERHLNWLVPMANAFINVFRFRIRGAVAT
jgi:hypothetical protein